MKARVESMNSGSRMIGGTAAYVPVVTCPTIEGDDLLGHEREVAEA